MLVEVGGRRRRRPVQQPRASMRGVPALVIGAPPGASPGELYRQGMAGMGAGNVIDTLTGGGFQDLLAKLAQVELALKISTAAAVGSALLSLALAMRRR